MDWDFVKMGNVFLYFVFGVIGLGNIEGGINFVIGVVILGLFGMSFGMGFGNLFVVVGKCGDIDMFLNLMLMKINVVGMIMNLFFCVFDSLLFVLLIFDCILKNLSVNVVF